MNTSTALKELIPVTSRGAATRRKLLSSAEIEFGTKGFPAASVSSITQRADVGQGTFYLYFHSKEEVFATLVRELGQQQRLLISAVATKPTVKNDGAALLAKALLDSIADNPGRYRLLREAQFMDEPVFRETHAQLFAAVAQVLVAAGAASATEAPLKAAALVGAAEQIALQQCLWADVQPNKAMVAAVLRS